MSTTMDIVERLRNADGEPLPGILHEAADEIERLAAMVESLNISASAEKAARQKAEVEVERLREALRSIERCKSANSFAANLLKNIARSALGKETI